MEEDNDAPQERDTKDFQFRQLQKLRIFEPPRELPKGRSTLLATSNKYGFLFFGSPSGLKIFSTKDVLMPIKPGEDPNNIAASPPGIDVPTRYPVHHVALSSDNLTLSVCMSSRDIGCIISFYDTRTLVNKVKQPKQAFASQILLQGAESFVADLKWNPVASTVAVCLCDGSISVLQVTDAISLYASLPASTGVTSVCWSPKGKQLAVGKQNGTVVQYLPNLQEKKVVPCPSFYDSDNPVKVLDVLWISTYVFAVVYAAADGSVETSPQLVMVLLPKKEDRRGERFLNFTEICYCSINNERQHHFFMNYVEDWDVLLGASAASIEVSVIAKLPDQNTWELWNLEDSGRAELPVTDNSDDTLPMGVVLDYSNQLEIEINEEKVLPPSPILAILSTDGVLCPFHVINLLPNVKSLTTPLEGLGMEGERQPRRASSVPSHPSQSPVPPPSVLPAITPAFSIPISNLASKAQPTPPAFSLPVTTSKPSQVFSPAAASFSSKPQTTSQVFSAPAASFPSKPQAVPQGFVVAAQSFPIKPQASSSGFGIAGTAAKPQESAAAFSFSTNSPSASTGSTNTGFSVLGSSQGFSFSAQGPPAFGTATSKPDISTTPAQQAASSGFSFSSTSNVKVNLNEKFNAIDTATAKSGFAPHTQSYPSTPPVKSTVTATPQSNVVPTPPHSQSMMAPNRSFPDGPSQPATPVMRQKSLKTGLSEVKQAPPQPQVINPILNAIQEEIAHFQKEMDELKARTAKACFTVGTDEEMRRLKTECNDLESFVWDIKATTESLHNDNGCLQTTLRDAFTTVQDANELNEKKKNLLYSRLLQQRPLDPKSEAQMQEIRRLNQYVEYAIQDVNNVLDYRWDQYLCNRKKQRGIAVPQRETLFNTLASHQEIINQQRQRLSQLVAKLQELGIHNQTSQWSVMTETSNGQRQFEEELKNLQITMSKTALETKPQPSPKVQPKIPKLKLNQLRNFLASRKPPVVRSLAPANLCRSSFLAPNYFEDLDDVSSTSSLSETADNEEIQASPQREAFKQETPPPEPSFGRTVRHAPVTRTASVQPGFGTPSLPFGKAQSHVGPITSTPAVPAQAIRVIPQGADSTMLATKTVKHGAPTVPAPQAAAAAALRRHMINQVSASLTESTLQTVPQVVNVKELKGNGPGPNISTVIGPSVPQSAAQVINQVLVTVGSAPIKQVPQSSGLKASPALTPTSSVIAQPGSGLAISKTGQISSKSEASSAGLSSGLPGNKAFTFSAPSGAFMIGNGATSSAPSSSLGSTAQAKDTSLPTPFINSTGNKFQFGLGTETNFAFGSSKPSTGIIVASLSDTTSARSTSDQAPPLNTSQSTGVSTAAAQTFTGGETLGSFSGLRVGQAEEVPKTEPSKVTPSLQPVKIPGASPLTGIGGFQTSKAVELSSTSSSSSNLFGNTKFTNTGVAGVLNPSGNQQNFSFTTPSTTTPGSEASSTAQVTSSLSFGGFIAPSASLQSPTTTVAAALHTSVPSSISVDAKQPTPEKAPNESVVLPSQLQALLAATTEGSTEPASALTPGRTMPTVPAVIPTVPKSQPATETKTTPGSIPPTTVSSSLNVPNTSTPASISHVAPAATATSEGPSSQAPVLVTSTPASGPTSTQVTSAPAESAATVSSFGQLSVAAATTPTSTAGSLFGQAPAPTTGTSLFGQQSSTSTTTSGIATSGFGTPVFGSADGSGGFGQPTFGQSASLWKAPAGSASNFSFAPSAFGSQSVFGQAPASTAATSSGSSLFGGSANTSSASSFSFGQPSSSSNASTSGGGLFGQSSTQGFGQSSTFGQSAPVFGSASSSTTTTSSSAFSFAQPSAFGSSSTGSVFGQSQSGNTNVFGQSSSSGGGLFGSGSNSTGGGGFFSGLGGKPSQEAANKNPFGTSNTGFGSPSSSNTNSLFGNSGAKSFGFGSTSFGEQKTTGTFSAGGSVATQGFGFSSPTKTGGFGAAPVFGSPPTFGGSPGFGGVPAFGSAQNFSSPLGSTGGKVFGEGTAAANTGGFGFGNNTSSTTFGSLAGQSTPTFGGLSQQGSGFGGQSSGFSGFGSSSGGTASGSSGGFSFGVSNQSTSGFGGGWRG